MPLLQNSKEHTARKRMAAELRGSAAQHIHNLLFFSL